MSEAWGAPPSGEERADDVPSPPLPRYTECPALVGLSVVVVVCANHDIAIAVAIDVQQALRRIHRRRWSGCSPQSTRAQARAPMLTPGTRTRGPHPYDRRRKSVRRGQDVAVAVAVRVTGGRDRGSKIRAGLVALRGPRRRGRRPGRSRIQTRETLVRGRCRSGIKPTTTSPYPCSCLTTIAGGRDGAAESGGVSGFSSAVHAGVGASPDASRVHERPALVH